MEFFLWPMATRWRSGHAHRKFRSPKNAAAMAKVRRDTAQATQWWRVNVATRRPSIRAAGNRRADGHGAPIGCQADKKDRYCVCDRQKLRTRAPLSRISRRRHQSAQHSRARFARVHRKPTHQMHGLRQRVADLRRKTLCNTLYITNPARTSVDTPKRSPCSRIAAIPWPP